MEFAFAGIARAARDQGITECVNIPTEVLRALGLGGLQVAHPEVAFGNDVFAINDDRGCNGHYFDKEAREFLLRQMQRGIIVF